MRKRKDNFKKMILCNRSLKTSEQLLEILCSKKCPEKFSKDNVYITQFAWDAQRKIKKNGYDYLFIDEVYDSNLEIEKIIKAIRRLHPDLKIIMFNSYPSPLINNLMANSCINSYVLMPFQDQHVFDAIEESKEDFEI